jgi:hypothetical protein
VGADAEGELLLEDVDRLAESGLERAAQLAVGLTLAPLDAAAIAARLGGCRTINSPALLPAAVDRRMTSIAPFS